ncbi:unnamed protein product [Toxocara canis]|uniref:Transposase n=1 Tax=Toxocara canis TaxID=6265 RepID=A0A183U0D2_TOXCA|nr:unnamed protein product [Toxocara canis]
MRHSKAQIRRPYHPARLDLALLRRNVVRRLASLKLLAAYSIILAREQFSWTPEAKPSQFVGTLHHFIEPRETWLAGRSAETPPQCGMSAISISSVSISYVVILTASKRSVAFRVRDFADTKEGFKYDAKRAN